MIFFKICLVLLNSADDSIFHSTQFKALDLYFGIALYQLFPSHCE